MIKKYLYWLIMWCFFPVLLFVTTSTEACTDRLGGTCSNYNQSGTCLLYNECISCFCDDGVWANSYTN